jgi:hypothetical protein
VNPAGEGPMMPTHALAAAEQFGTPQAKVKVTVGR